jgi:aryl-alcohol dehydrogenase-like predicted oxidoreductase
MRSVILPGTDLSSSRLGFGLSGLHRLLRSRSRQSLLAAAYDCGIRYFDTAPYYGHGIAERELGSFAMTRRDQVLIATKFGIEPHPRFGRFPSLMYARLAADATLRRITGRDDFAVERKRDFSAANAASSLNRSLRELRTDHVDILYLHEPILSRLLEADLLLEALQGFQSAGKVRYFGVAGSVQDCLAISRSQPALGRLMQIDATAGGLQILNEASIPFQASFGHFRKKDHPVDQLLTAAINSNRQGVILFSTTQPVRVASMVKLLTSLDAA